MPAKVITVTNQKGGSGKTTVAVNLAGTLGRRGYEVLLADIDPQGSASHYVSAAPEGREMAVTIAGLSKTGDRVHKYIQKFSDQYDYIVVDSPPVVDSKGTRAALSISHLVIIPVQPAPLDFESTKATLELVDNTQAQNRRLKARLLATACPHTSIAETMLEALGETAVPLMDASLGYRTAYREAAGAGLIVHDMGYTAQTAAEEVDTLTKEVLDILHPRGVPKPVKRDKPEADDDED
jgi:chromosome partitioning protein